MDVTSLLNKADAPEARHSRTSVSPSGTTSSHTTKCSSLPTPSPERGLSEAEQKRKPLDSTAVWHNNKRVPSLQIDTAQNSESIPTPRSPETGVESNKSLRATLGYQSRNSSIDSTKRLHTSSPVPQPQSSISKDDDGEDSEISESRNQRVAGNGRSSLSAARPETTQEQEAICMFVENCDTGSQLRKAISHLFGRNKACTLRIPKHVWVYYCRKHYQRVRYRNAKTYPLNQMELVKLQIHRLQNWSQENKNNGNGPYIKLWTLSLRKREQHRIEYGEDGADNANGGASDNVGVPAWLLKKIGTGYTTEDMLEVSDRLYQEIKDGKLSQIPEIEFLPDIIESDIVGKKASRRRRSSTQVKTPKRKASEEGDLLGRNPEDLHHAYFSHRRGSAMADGDHPSSPSGKRARVDQYQSEHHRLRESSLPSLATALPYSDLPVRPPFASSTSNSPRDAAMIPRIPQMDYHRDMSSRSGYSPSPNSASTPEYHIFSGQSDQGGHHQLPPLLAGFTSDQHAREARRPYSDRYESGRSLHARSSSAYSLASKPLGDFTRPRSSGRDYNEQPHITPRYSFDAVLPHPTGYDRRADAERQRQYGWHDEGEQLAYRPHSVLHEPKPLRYRADEWARR